MLQYCFQIPRKAISSNCGYPIADKFPIYTYYTFISIRTNWSLCKRKNCIIWKQTMWSHLCKLQNKAFLQHLLAWFAYCWINFSLQCHRNRANFCCCCCKRSIFFFIIFLWCWWWRWWWWLCICNSLVNYVEAQHKLPPLSRWCTVCACSTRERAFYISWCIVAKFMRIH